MVGMEWLERRQTVVAPDERVWSVRRILLPRPPRWIRKKDHRGQSAWDGAGAVDFTPALDLAADGPTALVVAVVVTLALLLFWAFLVPALFFLFDLLLVLLITLAGGAVRVLFRRPWKVEARTVEPRGESHSWGVVGLRASGDAVDTVARAIRRGTAPEQIRLAS